MNKTRNTIHLRSAGDLADAKELRAVIASALADATIDEHALRCAVWNFVETDRLAEVAPALVITRLTDLMDNTHIARRSAMTLVRS